MGQFLCWIADLNATTNENSWTLRLKEQSVEMEATSNKEPSQAVSDREHSESVEAAFKACTTIVVFYLCALNEYVHDCHGIGKLCDCKDSVALCPWN